MGLGVDVGLRVGVGLGVEEATDAGVFVCSGCKLGSGIAAPHAMETKVKIVKKANKRCTSTSLSQLDPVRALAREEQVYGV